MPELPEIETIRRALSAHIVGKRIERIRVRDPRLRWPVQVKKLKRLSLQRCVSDVGRRAKYLLINLEEEVALILHLGMSGRVLLLNKDVPFEKHDHVIFYFDDQTELRFRDPRRFGMVDAIRRNEIETYPRFVALGFEPLAKSTRAKLLFDKAHRLKRPIKNLLMDANFLVGVGNIYANEALFHAGIHPATPSHLLSSGDWQKLLRKVRRVLNKAIEKGGTTLNDFVNTNGEMGYFQLSLVVYGREGEKCSRCKSPIERMVQVGRSTFFCPQCQPTL